LLHTPGNDGIPESTLARDHSRSATGPLYRNSKVSPLSITDGLSRTVFVGEHTTISDKTWVGVVPGAKVCPNNPAIYPGTACDEAATLVLAHSGPATFEFDLSSTRVVHPPSFPTCHVCQMYAPWRGGMVLFGDGSVSFIRGDVDPESWAALCTINLGDLPRDE
jgi:hypothetical protein